MSPTDTFIATTVAPSAASLEVEQRKALWAKRLTAVFWVNSVAMSRDGKRVVAGTYIHDYDQKTANFGPNIRSRFGLYFFDDVPKVKTDKVEPKWSDEFDAWDGVYGVAISADGRTVAASGWLDKDADSQLGLLRAYDADGSSTGSLKLLLDFKDIKQRVSWVSLSADGRVLAAVADDVYVFLREGDAFNPVPLKLEIAEVANKYVTSIALHPSGTWLVACDLVGHVYAATIKNGAIGTKVTWNAQKALPFLSVAIAQDVDKFVAGGGNFVFLFDLTGVMIDPKGYTPLQFDTSAGELEGTVPKDSDDGTKLQQNVRWVATSADGKLITAAVNRLDDSKLAGKLFALSSDLTKTWTANIGNNPNSTSIDARGQYVAMADGYPTSKPAKFHLFDANGKKLWESNTCSMNWPMVINAEGDAIVAGSDDGTVYYFTPTV